MTSYASGAQSARFPSAPRGLVFVGDKDFPYRDDRNNVAPRIGLAWDVFGAGKTALRSSYGVFFEPLTAEMAGGVLIPQPYGLTYNLDAPAALSAPYRGAVDSFPYVVNPSNARFVTPVLIPKSQDPGVRIPYTMNYNFGVQQQVSRSILVDVSYVGNIGRKLPDVREFNPAVFRAGATTGNTNARRILAPDYQSIGMLHSDTNSVYNALQIQVNKRFSAGLTFTSAFTWAKAIDVNSGSAAFAQVSQHQVQNVFDVRSDRGPNDSDIRRRWVSSYLYELPFLHSSRWYARVLGGWELGGILTFESGRPVTVLTGRDNSLTGVNFDRPNVSGSPALPADRSRAQKLDHFFNTAVFAANAAGQFGNTGRNIVTGPGMVGWDTSLSKVFRIAEAHRLQFRWDAFNLPNRPNFGSPNGTVVSPAFGRIQSAGSGRIQQLSLKYSF